MDENKDEMDTPTWDAHEARATLYALLTKLLRVPVEKWEIEHRNKVTAISEAIEEKAWRTGDDFSSAIMRAGEAPYLFRLGCMSNAIHIDEPGGLRITVVRLEDDTRAAWIGDPSSLCFRAPSMPVAIDGLRREAGLRLFPAAKAWESLAATATKVWEIVMSLGLPHKNGEKLHDILHRAIATAMTRAADANRRVQELEGALGKALDKVTQYEPVVAEVHSLRKLLGLGEGDSLYDAVGFALHAAKRTTLSEEAAAEAKDRAQQLQRSLEVARLDVTRLQHDLAKLRKGVCCGAPGPDPLWRCSLPPWHASDDHEMLIIEEHGSRVVTWPRRTIEKYSPIDAILEPMATPPATRREPSARPGPIAPASPPQRGLFVVIEGIDGAGTTTQAARYAEHLRARRRSVHVTREPSGGSIGKMIREVIASARTMTRDQHRILALLFAADRLDHLASDIEPALARGEVVLCDRYDLSSRIYQPTMIAEDWWDSFDAARGWVGPLNDHARRPDITVVLDVSPDVAAQRRASRGGKPDLFEDAELQKRLAGLYARAEDFVPQIAPNDRVIHVDGNHNDPAIVAQAIADVLDTIIEQHDTETVAEHYRAEGRRQALASIRAVLGERPEFKPALDRLIHL